MKNFEFLHNITIGQYIPTGSRLHRLHPATKIFMAVLSMAVLFISNSLIGLTFALAVVLGGMVFARISLRYAIKGIRPAIPIIVLLALLQILASSQNDVGEVIWQGWKIILTKKDFLMAAVMVLRLVVLILVINLFSLSTSSKELTHGTEKLFKPLQRIGFPAHEIALILAIALRFIPLLAIEAERLVKAQASRGADFGKGRMGLFKRVYRMLPLFIPLFITALRRSETLILAMETRCYTGGKGRTQLIKFDYHASDAIAAGVVVIFASLVVISHFLKMDRQVWSWMAGK